MLFNSYEFILLFLPVSLTGYFLLGRAGKIFGAGWLALCSVFFYAWWDYRYVLLLSISVVGNFVAGKAIAAHHVTPKGKQLLAFAVSGNLVLLAYYKYADLFVSSANQALGLAIPLLHIVLPIGISFFTFTQIAFLVDAYQGKAKEYRFIHYALFVTYFPHLIAGPVLHHKEMMPQFDIDRNYRPRLSNFQIGLTIFVIGLCKKVLIADNLAVFAAPVFSGSTPQTVFIAWGGVLAYSLQLYFDFSGYSDMAIGLSRLFGIKLPLNFNSPYKAPNITEFWRRWHMTLSRFLRDYLYIPLGGNRQGPWRRQMNLLITMVLGGLWHGAGWNFVIWGALHGFYLVVNHAWQEAKRRLGIGPGGHSAKAWGVFVTFFFVTIAWVFFRAPDMPTAMRILRGMFGLNGAAIPEVIVDRIETLRPVLDALHIGTFLGGGSAFVMTYAWVLIGVVIAFGLPNTQEWMRRFSPALPDKRQASEPAFAALRLRWRPSTVWAMTTGLLAAACTLSLTRPTEFLYFQF